MKELAPWFRRHPLPGYFALAYGISWLIWMPLWLPALSVNGLPVLPFHHALGALGPIAAAFMMSALESGRGHVWVGHDDEVRAAIVELLVPSASHH